MDGFRIAEIGCRCRLVSQACLPSWFRFWLPTSRQQQPRAKSGTETSLGTRRQRQPRAKSWRETSLRNKMAAAAKSEDKLGRQAGSGSQKRSHEGRWRNKMAAAAKSEVMKGDKLGRQAGSGSQKRSHEGRQAWETRRQRQPKAKSWRETSLGDKAAAAALGDKQAAPPSLSPFMISLLAAAAAVFPKLVSVPDFALGCGCRLVIFLPTFDADAVIRWFRFCLPFPSFSRLWVGCEALSGVYAGIFPHLSGEGG